MQMYSLILLVVLFSFSVIDAFFLFKEKHEPILFCVKICPLYCHPRRQDEDASSLIYTDEQPDQPYYPYPYLEDHEPHPYHRFCKPPKPTTPAPTTTTTHKQPPYVYHDLFDDFGPPPYYYCCGPKPTTTTPKPTTTTEEPSGICMACKKKCGYPPKSDYLL